MEINLEEKKKSFPPNQPPNEPLFSCMNANIMAGEGGRENGNMHPGGWVYFLSFTFLCKEIPYLWIFTFHLVVVFFTIC